MTLNRLDHTDPLRDRSLLSLAHFSASRAPACQPLEAARFRAGKNKIVEESGYIRVELGSPADAGIISLPLSFILPEPFLSNGMGIRLRLSGFENINYIAIGYMENGTYRHAKATHPLQGEWFDFCLGVHDLAWGWRNNWQTPDDQETSEIRFYIKGVSRPEAICDVADIWVWQEETQPDAVFGDDQPIPHEVMDHLISYQRNSFPTYEPLARDFMSKGLCPLAGNTQLEWPVDCALPPRLHEIGTFQFSWHAQHPATMLMLLALDHAENGALFAARDMIVDWLERSYESPDPNLKYTWYDHGVAERVLSMLMLYAQGQKQGFDTRFMMRLRRAIHRHAQLLASDIFYASHQPIRYHNHAWFQDLALIAVGLAFPGWACADLWIRTALTRATDQFSKLIIRDGHYAIFAENSIGYHLGIEKIVSIIGTMARLSGHETDIPATAIALSRFSTLMTYPDGKRAPGQGDTFRLPNKDGGDLTGRKPYNHPQIAVLPHAGYAIIKANHGDKPFMLVFLATSSSSTHKHADNLSFTLYLDGVEWLLDPSFYSHEYKQDIPSYLRSSVAHNAFVLPDADYSIRPGLAQLSGEATEDGFYFTGSHQAVSGFDFRRRIDGSIRKLELHLSDSLGDAEQFPPEARLMLHFGEGVKAQIQDNLVQVTHPASDLILKIFLPSGSQIQQFEGHVEKPVRGVTGLGFLRSAAITTLEITPPQKTNELIWSIQAE
ncbi:MAG: heparinase II/III family protein [Xanthobacter sp.]